MTTTPDILNLPLPLFTPSVPTLGAETKSYSTKQMLEKVKNENGGTFRLFNGVWLDHAQTEGYFVARQSVQNMPTFLLDEKNVSALAEYWHIDPMRGLSFGTEYMGFWKNPEDGEWSIDEVLHTYSFKTAMRGAVANKQLAFWDIANSAAITV